jgi:phytoene dehydrogenase-like protein
VSETFDAVVVGAGVNGMVAAATLAKAGLSVCLLDGRERIGGFIASDSERDPGYVHDWFSSFHPLFSSGGAYSALGADLHRHGLEYLNADAPDAPLFASADRDGRVSIGYRDPGLTADAFADPRDRSAYRAMIDRMAPTMDIVGGLLGTELRDARRIVDAAKLIRRIGKVGSEDLVRDLATSGRALARRHFAGGEADHLWVPWLLHAGLAPDSAGGGLMLSVFALTVHSAGLPVVRGGAGNFVAAFESLFAELGVDVRTGTTVEKILVDGGRAVGVGTDHGGISARRAVLASVMPRRLYDDFLAGVPGLDEEREEARRYRFGRGAMQLHFALREPPAWRHEVLARTPVIHLSSGSASTGIACAEAEAGLLPRRPTIVVGQQYVLDPSRAPQGGAQLWIQLQEVPYRPVGDAAGEIDTIGGWTAAVTDAYVERVLDLIEEQAPGLRTSIVSRHAMTPVDLERENPNAVHGDGYGGSLELDQTLLWRPGPRTGRHRTAVDGLWHIGAATHPGAGLSGSSGFLAANAVVQRVGNRTVRLVDRLGR